MTLNNFRGIKEGRIDGLGKVNVLVGKNNSGKSTVLEALCFVKASLKPLNVLEEPTLARLLDRRIRRGTLDAREFFYRYGQRKPCSLRFSFEPNVQVALESHDNGPDRVEYDFLIPGKSASAFTISLRINEGQSTVNQTGQSSPKLADYLIRGLGANFPEEVRSYVKDSGEAWSFLSELALVDAEFVRKIEQIEKRFWGGILQRREDKLLRDCLNETYGTEIESFSFAPYEGEAHKLYTVLKENSIHIDDYGEGWRYAFAILTIASQLHNTALLLEEPEGHQHCGALLPLFKALLKFAESNKIQLFVTTHSFDIIQTLAQICNPENLRLFHFDLNSEGILATRGITGPDVKLMMDLGADMRKIMKPMKWLVLEGKRDRTFLESLVKKVYMKRVDDFWFQTVLAPRDEQNTVVAALSSTGMEIFVLKDYDENRRLDALTNRIESSLRNKYPSTRREDDLFAVEETGSKIRIIPLGLIDDSDLASVGVTRPSSEDYVLKLIACDEEARRWATIDLRDLPGRAQGLKDVTSLKTSLNSSKMLVGVLSVIKSLTPEDVIEGVIQNASSEGVVKVAGMILEPLFGKMNG